MMETAEEKTRRRIAEIWERSVPEVKARLQVLGRAAEAAAMGSLRGEQAEEARGLAHKLAGSLGMFGLMEGTRVAREIEMLLAGGEAEGAKMGELVAELRAKVFPEG